MLSIIFIFNMFFVIVFSQIETSFSSLHHPPVVQSSTSAFNLPINRDIPNPSLTSQISNPLPISGLINPLPISGLTKAAEIISSNKETLTSVVKATEGVCTRTQCYSLGDKIEQAARGAIMTETTREIDHASRVINMKFSDYTGPLVIAAITTPKVIDKFKKGDQVGAVGTIIDTVVKYKVGSVAFTSCAAYALPLMGPYSVIPGIGCSLASTLAIDGFYTSLFESKPPVTRNFRDDF